MIERNQKLIAIENKCVFNRYLKQNYSNLSELTFTNIFMWQEKFDTYFEIIKDFLCVFQKTAEFPLVVLNPQGNGDILEIFEELIIYFEKKNKPFVMKSLDYDSAMKFYKLYPERLKLDKNINSSDYVYLSEQLINLKGKKFHSKRNHINKFMEENDYRYEALSKDNIKDVYEFCEKWYSKRLINDTTMLKAEQPALFRALDNFGKLDFSGGVIYAQNKVAAFSLGEQLNSDTAVIHIEKADYDIQGSYAIINQQFCKHEFSHLKYINREEDLGIEGLRKAKQSYHPIYMVDKYHITF